MSLPNRLAQGIQATSTAQTDCFHCDRSGFGAEMCQLWRAWVCQECQMLYHRPHHPSCETPPSMDSRTRERRSRTYTVCLTRFDGQRLYIKFRIGQKLRMQDHPEGTYIFASHGVTLVSEKRATINERIVQGLGAIARPPQKD